MTAKKLNALAKSRIGHLRTKHRLQFHFIQTAQKNGLIIQDPV